MRKNEPNITPAFKTKLVLELLQNEQTLVQITIASITSFLRTYKTKRKPFLLTQKLPRIPLKPFKNNAQQQNECLTTLVSKEIVEKGWLAKKS